MRSGALAVVRFNWPFYALSGLVALAALIVLLMSPNETLVRGAALAAIPAIYFALASFLASFFVYDLSGITKWEWLREIVPRDAKAIANINAGFDDTTDAIRGLFPQAMVETWVFFDPSRQTERSIVRARKDQPARSAFEFDSSRLPLPAQSQDAVLLLFAAHEMREADERERFFRTAAAALRIGGVMVVVEHLRDFANALVYGPGAWHFYPRHEWLRLGKLAGLSLQSERQWTPFVRVFVFQLTCE